MIEGDDLREYIGECESCGKRVYCEYGFFDGDQTEEGDLRCNDCAQNEEKDSR